MRSRNTRDSILSIISSFALAVVLSGAVGCSGSRFSGGGVKESTRAAAGKDGSDVGSGKGKGTTNETNQGDAQNEIAQSGDALAGTPGSQNSDTVPPPVGTPPGPPISTPLMVEDACAKGELQKKPLLLKFAATDGNADYICPKTNIVNPVTNQRQKPEILADFHAQTAAVSLPPGALVCGTGIVSQTNNWKYDDDFVLTLNDVVLLTSQQRFLQDGEKDRMPRMGGGYVFDWNILAQAKFKVDYSVNPSAPYCYGGSNALACEFPKVDTGGVVVEGPVRLDLPTKALAPLALKARDDKKMEFKLWVTGDDEPDTDCKHSGLTLGGEVEYVVVP